MAQRSSRKEPWKKWWGRLRTKKAPGKEGATHRGSSSSMHDALSTAEIPSATPPPTSPPASTPALVGNTSREPSVGGVLNARDEAGKEPSLWDRAFDALAEEKGELVSEYEGLLSRALNPNPQTIQSASEEQNAALVPNLIPHDDPEARQQRLNEVIGMGLQHMEDKKVRTTVLGHTIVWDKAVAKAASAATWAEQLTKEAVKDVPYASIVMAGVSLILPLLKNPVAADAANSEGLTYVTLRMRYYTAMEQSLFPEDMEPAKKGHFTALVVELYKQIIDFQVQSCLRFYRAWTKNYLRGAVEYDDWRGMVQRIKAADAEIISDSERSLSTDSLRNLQDIARDADATRARLDEMLPKMQELIDANRDHNTILQRIEQHITDPADNKCLQALCVTDPRHDKTRIMAAKDELLRDAFCWVLDNEQFKQWHDADHESRLLWIQGDPGKGKTMLVCGLIEELERPEPEPVNITFFFCQATDARINNATSVLRGLIFLLIHNQPDLISHLRQQYDPTGDKLFQDANAWQALSKIFNDILRDPRLQSTYLIIDALDECTTGLDQLLKLIVAESSTHSKLKWIVSSRNWPTIKDHLQLATQRTSLSLELNKTSVSAAVTSYIRCKVRQLPEQKGYTETTRQAVREHLDANARGTFLWVALVYKVLRELEWWEVDSISLQKLLPSGLEEFYGLMLKQIDTSRHAKLCKNILTTVSIAQRPITLDELEALVDIPPGASGNDGALSKIIGDCGSFLSLRQRTIFFVH